MKSLLREFDEQAQKAIVVAESLSFDFGHQNVGSEHLLLSLLKIHDNQLKRLLQKYDVMLEIWSPDSLIRLSKKSDIWVVVFVSRYMTHHVLSDFRSMHINEEYFQDHFSILCMPCFRISYRIMRSGRLLMS